MIIQHIFIFGISLFLAVKGTTLATKYSAKIADSFHMSKYIVGFIIVAFISILPETIIAISAALEGVPELGLGTLFGSNIADLTLIFAIIVLYAGRGIRIESKVMKVIRLYPFFLLIPVILGLNGHYSRLEGAALIVAGALFYYLVFKNGVEKAPSTKKEAHKAKNVFMLLFAMLLLIAGSHFLVDSAAALAEYLRVAPILIGLLVVSLGTTMPELFYSIKAIKRKDDGLAIGDIMGSVLADATIVVGVLAFISPFSFPAHIIYITGGVMVVASLMLLRFMHSGNLLTKKEGYILLGFWIAYAFLELVVNI